MKEAYGVGPTAASLSLAYFGGGALALYFADAIWPPLRSWGAQFHGVELGLLAAMVAWSGAIPACAVAWIVITILRRRKARKPQR